MTAYMLAPVATPSASKSSDSSALPARRIRVELRPAKPDRQLWETDEEQAFEAGVQWFLAVSRAA